MKRALFAACLVVLALGAGCASPLGTSKARPIAAGKWQVGGSLDTGLLLMKRSPGRAVPLPHYTLGLGARYGVWRGVDIGARVDGKLHVLRAPSADTGFDGMVGLALAYHAINLGGAPIHSVTTTIPISFGWNTGGGSQLFAGPRVALDYVASPTAKPVTVGRVGAHVGYAWRLFDHLELTPELHVTWSPLGWDGLIDNPERRGLTLVHLGTSASWEF
jgi:hypothetical protein